MNFPLLISLAFRRRFLAKNNNFIRNLSHKISTNVNMASRRLIWVDLEMTGLNIETCHIIEMACLITDENLNIVAEGPDLVIHQPDRALEVMDDWCTKHHGESGLTAAVRASKISLSQAEQTFLDFVKEHTPAKQCPLAGNSVHADKKFLDKYMPQFMDHLHYRIVDVSTIKELCRRWYPKTYQQVPRKKGQHRALEDIKESITELRFYKRTIFK
ncbi:oligoribonuclease, mitochondrial-like [Orbicella faveolata]|uniref:oligoribonuclease, mitochondrial-like n=1 Tax=Orbicella faveolata TaxID=48498 RepID=UPI0009E1C800|nr:oligoribonuclease, mitochondrial-like [Orbicella faveolata]